MKRLARAMIFVLVALTGAAIETSCQQDPARSVKIAQPAATPVPEPTSADAAQSGSEWRPERCPPPAELSGGPSTLIGSGACAFQQIGPAKCSKTDDDVMMEVLRPMPGDALFMVYFSVENFHRSGEFNNAQFVVGVQEANGLFRWATDKAHVTMSSDERTVKVEDLHLPAVPPMQQGEVIVSGTLWCADGPIGGRR